MSGAIAHTVNSRGLERIRYDGSELGRLQRVPIEVRDLTQVAAAARHDRARVLLRPHHPIRVPVIGGDVIDLRDRYLVIAAPGLPAVERHRRALIEAEQHPLAVGRIDPDLVRVLTAGRALECAERFAAVG